MQMMKRYFEVAFLCDDANKHLFPEESDEENLEEEVRMRQQQTASVSAFNVKCNATAFTCHNPESCTLDHRHLLVKIKFKKIS